MRLDQDKQIEDLATFQRGMSGPKELTQIAINHLQSQGFALDDLNTEKQETDE